MIPETLDYNNIKWRKRTMISTATEGWIRYEWAHARYSQIIPVNWEMSGYDIAYTAIGYSIDDAYNVITKRALEHGVEWLMLFEDDTLMPPDTLVRFAQYMEEKKYPVVSGLYYTKAQPSEPLLFRGRGNGCYRDWKFGDVVMCDGLPMGCLLLHCSLLKWMSDNVEEYRLPDGTIAKKVFETPRKIKIFEDGSTQTQMGTQDLYFFDRLVEFDVLEKCGWTVEDKANPFVCDTNIFCKHIDRATGQQYPLFVVGDNDGKSTKYSCK